MFSKEKFKALVHFACAKVSNPRDLGAVKLNKVAWFVDGIWFLRTGESMTGARYMKQPMGPVPKAMLPVLNELQQEGAIRIEEVLYFGKRKKEYVSLKEPNVSVFTDDQIDLIVEVIDAITKNHTATSISDATHGTIWQLAETGEDMPFHAMLVEDLDEVSPENLSLARDQLQKYSSGVSFD